MRPATSIKVNASLLPKAVLWIISDVDGMETWRLRGVEWQLGETRKEHQKYTPSSRCCLHLFKCAISQENASLFWHQNSCWSFFKIERHSPMFRSLQSNIKELSVKNTHDVFLRVCLRQVKSALHLSDWHQLTLNSFFTHVSLTALHTRECLAACVPQFLAFLCSLRCRCFGGSSVILHNP